LRIPFALRNSSDFSSEPAIEISSDNFMPLFLFFYI
jgi:hypothetical protein